MIRITILVFFRTALYGYAKSIDLKQDWGERGWKGVRYCIVQLGSYVPMFRKASKTLSGKTVCLS